MGDGDVKFRPGVKIKCIHSFLTTENWESYILAFKKSFFSSTYNCSVINNWIQFLKL